MTIPARCKEMGFIVDLEQEIRNIKISGRESMKYDTIDQN